MTKTFKIRFKWRFKLHPKLPNKMIFSRQYVFVLPCFLLIIGYKLNETLKFDKAFKGRLQMIYDSLLVMHYAYMQAIRIR